MVRALAERLGAAHPGFEMTPRELIDHTLRASGWEGVDRLEAERWFDCQPDFDDSHYTGGFAHPDGKFRFSPDWAALAPHGFVGDELLAAMPRLPDHWEVIEEATEENAVPHGDCAGAALSQLVVHRDPDLDPPRSAARA